MRLSQLLDEQGQHIVCATGNDGISRRLSAASDIRRLALDAIEAELTLPTLIADRMTDEVIDLKAALDGNRILVPVNHPDPVHIMVSGSGLSHQSWLNQEPDHGPDEDKWPDYYKVLMLGKRGGKPAKGEYGSQPEWFYKGTGDILVAPGGEVEHPSFGVGLGEEAEIAGIYIIGADKKPFCIGYTLGNEFSDEYMYFGNSYHLAHSKRRHVSLGPEILIGDLPQDIAAKISLYRDGNLQWESEFHTGEKNMLHTIANIEAHYFKYAQWHIPGDIHVLYFGNAVMSTEQGEVVEDGDVFKLECDLFGLSLTNTVAFGRVIAPTTVKTLW